MFRFITIAALAGYFLTTLPALSCTTAPGKITIGSFNVKFVGYYDEKRDNKGLATLMKDCDVVVI